MITNIVKGLKSGKITGYDSKYNNFVDGFIATLKKISNMIDDETVIIPGHGALAKKSDLLEFKNMLETIRNRVSKGIEGGKTLGQIAESNPTKGFELGGPIPVNEFVKIIYSSLVK